MKPHESRPGENRAAKSTAITKPDDLFMLRQVADVERQRRVRLRRALHRVAERLQRHHPDAAALARAWAGDAA